MLPVLLGLKVRDVSVSQDYQVRCSGGRLGGEGGSDPTPPPPPPPPQKKRPSLDRVETSVADYFYKMSVDFCSSANHLENFDLYAKENLLFSMAKY